MEITFRDLKVEDIPQVLNFFIELKRENAGVSYIEYDSEGQIREWLNPQIYLFMLQ